MKRMLSILALLGAFLLMPFVTQAQTEEQYTITINQVEHATIKVTAGILSPKPVNSGDKVAASESLTIQVTPEAGYVATHYTVNGVDKPITSSYGDFEFVEGDMTISAKVVAATPCTVTITQPTEGGTLIVRSNKTLRELSSGAQVDAGTEISLEVKPAEGYDIDYWLIDGEQKKPSSSKYLRYSYTHMVMKDVEVSVKLKSSSAPASGYLVTYDQPEGGTLTVKTGYPSSKEVKSGTRVNERATLEISATVNAGYQFKHFLINGDEKVPANLKQPRISEPANSDMTIAAVIEKVQPCIVTITPFEHGALKVVYGSALSPVEVGSGDEVPADTQLRISATFDDGFELDHFLVNGEEARSANGMLNYIVKGSVTLSAVAKAKATPQPTTYTVTLGNVPAEQGYYYAYYDGGSIDNGGSKAVPAGTEVTFQIDIANDENFNAKYKVTSWSVNGTLVEVKDPEYKFTPTEDVTVFPVLEKIGTEPDPGTDPTPKGKVTLIQPKNEQGKPCGKLTASYYDEDIWDDVTVADGDEVPAGTLVSFEVELAENYEMVSWKFNGETEKVGPFDKVTTHNSHEVSAEGLTVEPIVKKKGAAAVEYTITMVQPQEGQGTLTAHVGDKTYRGEFKATAGTEIFFSVEPATDYEMYYWLINDQRVDPSAGNPNQLTRKVEGNLKVEPILMSKSAPEPTKFSVTLGELPAEQGTFTATYGADKTSVQSGDELPDGTEITFTATPAEGYEFDYWMVNDAKSDDTNNPLVITLSAAVKVAPVMKAKPAPQPTEAKITMIQPDATQGKLIAYTYGSDSMPLTIVDGMTVKSGTEVTFAVSLKDGYEMDYWMVNDQRQEVEAGEFPHKKTIKVTSDIKVQPVLKAKTAPQPKKFEVSYSCGDHATIAGTVNGVPFESGDKLAVGTEVVLTVTPEEGYEVKHWIDSDDEVVPGSEGKNSYTFTVDGYTSIVAKIQKKKDTPQYETVHVKVEYESINGSITTTYVAPDGSSQSITGEDDIPVGSVVTLRAMIFMPDYQVVYMNNGEVVSKDALSEDGLVYTFTANEDASIQALFSKKTTPEPTNKAKVTVKREGTGGFVMGNYKEPGADMVRNISEGQTMDLPIGTVVTLTATVTEGFQVTYTNNGEAVPAASLSEEGKVYTFTVKGDATVLATFAQKEVPDEDYTVTFEAGKGGSLTATADMEPIESGDKVATGSYVKFTAKADKDYEIGQWMLNGKVVENWDGKETYIFTLTKDVTVKVTFKSTKPVEYAVTVAPVLPSAEAGTVKLYKENGTAVESGTAVAVNTKMYVEVKPAAKYELETLQVNNTTIKAGDAALVNLTGGGFKYSFTVTEATTIKATFKLGGAVEQLTQNQIVAYVTNGGTRLEVTGATEGTEVRLYDYTGQLLLSSTEHALDISALPAGGYIVLVGNYTTRIVK